MGVPSFTMDHRGGSKSIKPTSPSSSKFLPSSYTSRQTNLPLNLKHFPKNTLSNKTQPNFHNISRPVKHHKISTSTSTSSKKRTCDDEPFQTYPIYPTSAGLAELLDVPSKKLCLDITRPETEVYSRRQKVAKYATMIRQKKLLAKKVSRSSIRMKLSFQKGLPNLTGALCYRISLFQALLHQPMFVNWLLDSHQPQDCVTDEECLPCALRLLVLGYWSGAHELSKLFRGTHGMLKTLGWSADVQSGHADPEEQAAWIFGAIRAVIPSSSFASLDSFMQLTTTSAIRCKCGHVSSTEGHSDRALPIPITPRIQNGTLAHYLHKYMVEIIEGYRCEKCKDDAKKHRKILIGHAPDILAVQLKRFNWNGTKDNSPITINTTLDLNKYRDTNNHDHLIYELSAVIKHAGTASFGHYICSAKGPDGVWYCFDDESVSKSSVSDATSSKSRFTPYLLFFQRKET